MEIPFRYRVFYLILRIPNQNRHYFWRTRPNPLSYFFYIRYQTNFVSPKLEQIYRCVDLGVIFVLQLTRLNWSREVVGIDNIRGAIVSPSRVYVRCCQSPIIFR